MMPSKLGAWRGQALDRMVTRMQCQNNEAASCRRMGVAHHVCTSWLALDCFIQLLRRGTEQQAHVCSYLSWCWVRASACICFLLICSKGRWLTVGVVVKDWPCDRWCKSSSVTARMHLERHCTPWPKCDRLWIWLCGWVSRGSCSLRRWPLRVYHDLICALHLCCTVSPDDSLDPWHWRLPKARSVARNQDGPPCVRHASGCDKLRPWLLQSYRYRWSLKRGHPFVLRHHGGSSAMDIAVGCELHRKGLEQKLLQKRKGANALQERTLQAAASSLRSTGSAGVIIPPASVARYYRSLRH